MFSPSLSSAFTAYASLSTSILLIKNIFNQLIPPHLQHLILSKIMSYFKPKPKTNLATYIIKEKTGMSQDLIYEAVELYLSTKISPDTERLIVSKSPKQTNYTVRFAESEKIVDSFEGIEVTWSFIRKELKSGPDPHGRELQRSEEKRLFELSFEKQFKSIVLDSYLPYVEKIAEAIRNQKKVLKMYNLGNHGYPGYPGNGGIWDSIHLQHPSTFETLAMDVNKKKEIIDDLNRFVGRREFYKKVGKAWKRGYLLYGPPGTGKSSLIAAMANYLKFDVYDLQLTSLTSDAGLRRLLLATNNRSILVIEDIDCSTVDMPVRGVPTPLGTTEKKHVRQQISLSGLLNFTDGLWSSCGDERIIIFTTNNIEKLDPALLRPGRMDRHIEMSYCTEQGFKVLASNYLGIHGGHRLFGQIEDLINQTKVTPAEVAEELMRSGDADVSLERLVDFLKRKRTKSHESKSTDGSDGVEVEESKKMKIVGSENIIDANGLALDQ